MKEYTDWKPDYTLEKGLAKTIQSYMG